MKGIYVTDYFTIYQYKYYYSVQNNKTKKHTKIFGQKISYIKLLTYGHISKNYSKKAINLAKKFLTRKQVYFDSKQKQSNGIN